MILLKTIGHFLIGRTKRAILIYRMSSWCYRNKLKIFGQLFWSINVMLHSLEISPLAKIDKGFRIAHSVGIVIGAGVVIGKNLTIYQNVTLGTKGDKAIGRTYPIIGDNVILYPGSVVIGGITIGDNSIVAPNAVVISDVPPNSIAMGIPAKIKSISKRLN